MDNFKYIYEVEYKEPKNKHWDFWEGYDNLEDARQEVLRQKEQDAKYNFLVFEYRIIEKKFEIVSCKVIE